MNPRPGDPPGELAARTVPADPATGRRRRRANDYSSTAPLLASYRCYNEGKAASQRNNKDVSRVRVGVSRSMSAWDTVDRLGGGRTMTTTTLGHVIYEGERKNASVSCVDWPICLGIRGGVFFGESMKSVRGNRFSHDDSWSEVNCCWRRI